MEKLSYYTTIISFILVIICWFVFAGTFLLRKKSASAPDKTSAPRSLLGIVLQGVAFGLVWALHRTPLFSPFIDSQHVLNIVFQVIAVVLAAGSVWMANSAIRELGKQWSLQARLIEGHKLVTGGVYQMVRHPIYTAMLGKLLATGIIISHWLVVLIAVVIFIIGTLIRTRSEEKLLRDAFGKEYEEWAARVPGFIPFVKI
jgi:protein-S-isoprenylcysteine O-methyltransferase Ste14